MAGRKLLPRRRNVPDELNRTVALPRRDLLGGHRPWVGVAPTGDTEARIRMATVHHACGLYELLDAFVAQ